MSKTKTKYPNHLTRYRERLGLTQEQLAKIVSCRTTKTIRRIESGTMLPRVGTMFRLSAALRIPVEFIYQETYLTVREEVRAAEERMPKGRQGVLPLPL